MLFILYDKWPSIAFLFGQSDAQLFPRPTIGVFDRERALINIDSAPQTTAQQSVPQIGNLQLCPSKSDLDVLCFRDRANGETQLHLFVVLRPRVSVALSFSKIPSRRIMTCGSNGILLH